MNFNFNKTHVHYILNVVAKGISILKAQESL